MEKRDEVIKQEKCELIEELEQQFTMMYVLY